MKVTYTYKHEENNGYDDCDILVKYYNEDGFRMRLMSKEEFATLQPWEFCRHLNDAYAQGKKDAMEEVRRLLGVKE